MKKHDTLVLWLLEKLKEKGITRKQAAQQIGVSYRTLYNRLNSRNISYKDWGKLCEMVGYRIVLICQQDQIDI